MNVDSLIRKCRHCQEPAGSTGRCVKHNDAHKADSRRRLAARKAAGLCPCGLQPSAGRNFCDACRNKQRASQARKRADGDCIRCAKGNRAVAAGMCRRCWFKKIASDSLKQRGQSMPMVAEALEMIWERQGGLCALTGEKLVMGSTASIDHIVPQSQGGDHSLANLQWVTFHVNVAKHALSQNDFIALCRRVLAHKDR